MCVAVIEVQLVIFQGLQEHLSTLGCTFVLGKQLMERLLDHAIKAQQERDHVLIERFPKRLLQPLTLPIVNLEQLESHLKVCQDPTPHSHILQGYVTVTLEA